MDFGERLKNLRIERGLTQEDVAYAMNVTKQAVSKWENGLSLPDVASLGNLANLLGVNVDYLLTGNDNVKIEKEIEIVEKEVIKEKIVEVERPLTKNEMTSLLFYYQRLFAQHYISIVLGIILIIGGIVWFIYCKNSDLLVILAVVFVICGMMAILIGVGSRERYIAEKKEIEQKTGMKVGLFKFKNKK